MARSANHTPRDWLLFGLAAALFLFFIALHAHTIINGVDRIPWRILVPIAASLAFAHSWYLLGWQRAVVLMACATLISFASEWVGQSSGWLYGPYCYTPLLGAQIGGRIPFLIPFAWYMMFYPSYVVSNLVAEGRPVSNTRARLTRVLWMAALSAAVMTAWDITMDPIMSFEPMSGTLVEAGSTATIPAWRWLTEVVDPAMCASGTRLPPSESTHFGVPWKNYQGWMITSFVVFLVYRLLERRIPLRRRAETLGWSSAMRLVALMPVAVYMAMALVDAVLGSARIEDVHLISPFAMGITAAIASMAVFKSSFAAYPEDAAVSPVAGDDGPPST